MSDPSKDQTIRKDPSAGLTGGVSADFLDKAGAVRSGEELDIQALGAWMQEQAAFAGFMPDAGSGSVALEVQQYKKGYSNLTYLLRAKRMADSAAKRGAHSGANPAAGEIAAETAAETAADSADAHSTEWVLRRPPFGSSVKTAHDMGREYRVLSALQAVYPKVPRVLAYCEDPGVLGAPFYVMEKVTGVILRPNMPEAMRPSPEKMHSIAYALVDSLAALHAVDIRAAGLAEFGRPEGYVQRQVEGWIKRYQAAKTADVPDMERAAHWLVGHRRESSGVSLIHNDFKYDNLVLNHADWTDVVAVLDWEMATIGDPLMDVGTTLGYWVHPGDLPPMRMMALSPTVLPGNPSRAEVLERYAAATGRHPGNGVFYYVYGLYKIAVIVQQIYARYQRGLTRDERFASLGFVVQSCAASAVLAIDKGRIDQLWE
jgi:aminoglycoside phosphotransferase (APT) family kinase protein